MKAESRSAKTHKIKRARGTPPTERESEAAKRGDTLQLDALAAHLDCPAAKFNADGAGVVSMEFGQKASVEVSLTRTCFFGERTPESATRH
jgi:hypothetical protein